MVPVSNVRGQSNLPRKCSSDNKTDTEHSVIFFFFIFILFFLCCSLITPLFFLVLRHIALLVASIVVARNWSLAWSFADEAWIVSIRCVIALPITYMSRYVIAATYVIKFLPDFWKVGGFLFVLLPIKLTVRQ